MSSPVDMIMQNNETTVKRSRILVVDDDKDIASYLGAVLTLDGYEAIETHRAEEAIEVIRSDPPDLVLTDLMMPGLGGLGLLTYLKQDKTLPFIPVIMITALHDSIDKAAALESGCDDFLMKPINKAELQARVRSLLRLKRTNDSLNRRLAQRETRPLSPAEQTPPPENSQARTQSDEVEGYLSKALNQLQMGIMQNGLSRRELVVIAEEIKQALATFVKMK